MTGPRTLPPFAEKALFLALGVVAVAGGADPARARRRAGRARPALRPHRRLGDPPAGDARRSGRCWRSASSPTSCCRARSASAPSGSCSPREWFRRAGAPLPRRPLPARMARRRRSASRRCSPAWRSPWPSSSLDPPGLGTLAPLPAHHRARLPADRPRPHLVPAPARPAAAPLRQPAGAPRMSREPDAPAPRITRRGPDAARAAGRRDRRARPGGCATCRSLQNERYALLAEENRVNIRLHPAGPRPDPRPRRAAHGRQPAELPRHHGPRAGRATPRRCWRGSPTIIALPPEVAGARAEGDGRPQRLRAGGGHRAPDLGRRGPGLGQRPGPARA